MEKFKAVTGKNAIWRGKITKGYLVWKKKQGGQTKRQISTIQKKSDSVIFEIQSKVKYNLEIKVSQVLCEVECR